MTNTEAPLDKNISIKSQMFREFNMSFDKKNIIYIHKEVSLWNSKKDKSFLKSIKSLNNFFGQILLDQFFPNILKLLAKTGLNVVSFGKV